MQYLILSTLVFMGIFCGLAVGKIAEEELSPGKDQLKWFMHLLFLTLLIIFFYLNQSIIFFIAISLMLILFSLTKEREALYYYALAPIMFLAYLYNGFVIIAPLIFLYGFPLGSLFLEEYKTTKMKANIKLLLVKYSGFFAMNLILGIIQLNL